MRCVARWGLRALRIGEASHPGPASDIDEVEIPEILEHPFAAVDLEATPVLEADGEPSASQAGTQQAQRSRVPLRAWRELRELDIEHVFTVRVRTVRDCPALRCSIGASIRTLSKRGGWSC